jgi:anti-sigma factor RsiW
MTCSEFIEGFSDFVDGVGDPECMRAARAHLDRCPSCRRYEQTYAQGITLLRSFPDLTVHDGFVPELDRRLRRETALALEGLGRRPVSSWSPMTMVLGMALVLVGAAWSPFLLTRTVQVDLPPIQAQTPRARALPLVRMPDITLLPNRARRPGGAFATAELWEEPSSLFRQYAPVMRGYAAGDVRVGID